MERHDEKIACELKPLNHIRAGQDEEIVRLEALEDVRLELDKVVRDEQREHHVVVRVDRDIERHHLVEEHARVDDEVHGDDRKVEQQVPLPRAPRHRRPEEGMQNILAKGCTQLVEDLEHVEDDVQLDHGLPLHRVVRLRRVDLLEREYGDSDRADAHGVAHLQPRKSPTRGEHAEARCDAEREHGKHEEEGVEANEIAEDEQLFQLPRRAQEVVDPLATPARRLVLHLRRHGLVDADEQLVADEGEEGDGRGRSGARTRALFLLARSAAGRR
mmetsp:Transcript_15969/g.49720  ORF Transcript_15969/g.49720 Transcript_15969/m.49720 type:complete len:273 (+) Transcript_15969:646-1464(+)